MNSNWMGTSQNQHSCQLLLNGGKVITQEPDRENLGNYVMTEESCVPSHKKKH